MKNSTPAALRPFVCHSEQQQLDFPVLIFWLDALSRFLAARVVIFQWNETNPFVLLYVNEDYTEAEHIPLNFIRSHKSCPLFAEREKELGGIFFISFKSCSWLKENSNDTGFGFSLITIYCCKPKPWMYFDLSRCCCYLIVEQSSENQQQDTKYHFFWLIIFSCFAKGFLKTIYLIVYLTRKIHADA